MFESCNPDSFSLALPVVMFLFGGILSTVNDLIKPSFLCPLLGAKKSILIPVKPTFCSSFLLLSKTRRRIAHASYERQL